MRAWLVFNMLPGLALVLFERWLLRNHVGVARAFPRIALGEPYRMLAPTRPDVRGDREASYRSPPMIPFVDVERLPTTVVLSENATLHRYPGTSVWRVERTEFAWARRRTTTTLVLVVLEHSGEVVELRAYVLPSLAAHALAPITGAMLFSPSLLLLALPLGSAALAALAYTMTRATLRRDARRAFDAIEDALADMDVAPGDALPERRDTRE